MSTARVLVVDNHDSYTYNVVGLIAEVVGAEPTVIQHDQLDLDSALASGFTHIVISPGPGHPADPDDFGVNLELIRCADVPVLGICLGHQGIAVAFGGQVTAVEPAHGRLDAIEHDGTGLFAGVRTAFTGVRYHSLAVTGVPDTLRVTARSGDGVIMALEHRTRPIYGVQFHPESILSDCGAQLMANFLDTGRRHGTAGRDGRAPSAEAVAHARVRPLDAWVEPEAVFVSAQASAARLFWLDSSAARRWSGRFSYLGWLLPSDLSVTYDAATRTVTEHPGNQAVQTTIFDYLDGAVRRETRGSADVPFDFQGGWVGYFGYECKADTFGELVHRAPTPDACFLRARRFLAFDHEHRQVYAVADCDADLAMLAAAIDSIAGLPAAPPRLSAEQARLVSAWSKEEYGGAFFEVQRELRAGNTYELNLTYQATLDSVAEPPSVYRLLRQESPTPYSAYFEHDGVAVLSSSPERFLTVDAAAGIDVRPIKGTTPRGATPEEDARHQWVLEHEPRFQAENLMIVDLVRNDLSRICVPGTVTVPELMVVESYTNVHQLVTTVRGRLREDQNAVTATRALFPSGSMTGAPKERTMEIIDAVESTARGVYSGALGWLSLDGRADFSVVIRALVAANGQYSFGVGGGVIVLSDPDSEREETAWKAERMLRALARATGGPVDVDSRAALVATATVRTAFRKVEGVR
jgi:para-aminobenzoate synthetase